MTGCMTVFIESLFVCYVALLSTGQNGDLHFSLPDIACRTHMSSKHLYQLSIVDLQ